MRLKHYFLIYLVIFAVGYTTVDRLNDAVEVMEVQTISNVSITNFADPHHPSCVTDEVFCDFPMIAKIIIALSIVILSFSAFITPHKFKPFYYHGERFRPPAYTAI